MKHAYINGIILDGSKEMEPQQDKVILTDGENIEAIVEKAQIEDKDLTEYEITDLAGNYIMPGLINLHLHLPLLLLLPLLLFLFLFLFLETNTRMLFSVNKVLPLLLPLIQMASGSSIAELSSTLPSLRLVGSFSVGIEGLSAPLTFSHKLELPVAPL